MTFIYNPLFIAAKLKTPSIGAYILASMIAAPICTIMGKLLLPNVDILPVFWGVMGSLVFVIIGILDNNISHR